MLPTLRRWWKRPGGGASGSPCEAVVPASKTRISGKNKNETKMLEGDQRSNNLEIELERLDWDGLHVYMYRGRMVNTLAESCSRWATRQKTKGKMEDEIHGCGERVYADTVASLTEQDTDDRMEDDDLLLWLRKKVGQADRGRFKHLCYDVHQTSVWRLDILLWPLNKQAFLFCFFNYAYANSIYLCIY